MSSERGAVPSPPRRVRPSTSPTLGERERELLRQLAVDSIQMGMEEGCPLPVVLERFPKLLRTPGAVFVTLKQGNRLRGCIGSFQPRRSLVEDVSENAFAAAFRDPRFSPLTLEELPGLGVHLSLLSPLEPFPVKSRKDLVTWLERGRDGLLVEDGSRRSIFLPQVWESLPDPDDFLGELLLKAGLPRDYWSRDLVFHRYTVQEF